MTTLIDRNHYPDLQYIIWSPEYNDSDVPDDSSSSSESASGFDSSNTEFVDILPYVFDHDTWVDAAWFRDEGNNATSSSVRLLRIDDGQTLAAARTAAQWITQPLQSDDVTANTKADFTLMSTRGGVENKMKVGGRIAVVFDEPWPGLSQGVIGIRVREWRLD